MSGLVQRLKRQARLSVIPDTDLDIDDALAVIRNSRRRRAIRCVVETIEDDERLTLGELTEVVACAECETDDLSTQQRKRVYVSLYQTHVDDLISAGVLMPVPSEENEYYRGPNAEPLHDIVRVIESVCGGEQ